MSGGMSEEQVSAAPRRRTAEEAAQLVTEYEASQLSKHDFCRAHGLAISTLDAYRSGRRLGLAKRKTCWINAANNRLVNSAKNVGYDNGAPSGAGNLTSMTGFV